MFLDKRIRNEKAAPVSRGCFAAAFLDALLFQHRVFDIIALAAVVFLGLAIIPVLHRAIITGDAAVNLCRLAAIRAGELLACQIAVLAANGIGGGDGVVGELIILRDLPHQGCSSLPAR